MHITHLSFGKVLCISLACALRTVYFFLSERLQPLPVAKYFQLYLGLSPPAPSASAKSSAPKHPCRRLVAGAGLLWSGVKGSGKPFSGGQATPWLAPLP